MRTRRIQISTAVAVLGVLTLCCTREASLPDSSSENFVAIVLDASVSGNQLSTKGVTTPTEADSKLSYDYSIYASAYYTDPEFPATDGDFFTGVKFDYNELEGGWTNSSKTFYWPLAGGLNSLDFLAVATDTSNLNISKSMVWAGPDDRYFNLERNVHGVKISVPDGGDTTEVLFATAHRLCGIGGHVGMTFKHTQCCLEFHVRLEGAYSDIIRLDRIVLEDAYTSGECLIATYPTVSVAWNFDKSDLHSKDVPCVEPSTPMAVGRTLLYRMVLPPQPKRDILFFFRQTSSDESDDRTWREFSVRPSYDVTYAASGWVSGKKYVFEVIVKPGEVIVVPSVADWKDGKDVIIPV